MQIKSTIFKFIRYFFIFLFFFFLFFITGFHVYYWYQYPHPLDKSDFLEHYPEDIILKTGAKLEYPNRKDHFLNFPLEKKSGAIRIGTFGDSFVFGADVDEESSYPRHLQNKLTEHFPNKRIEVLNFGVSGSGFQEQFFLWEKYAQRYGLDYILIGPRWFHPDRSATFRKNWGGFQKRHPLNYPHERFILSYNGTLKRVHIKGKTLKKRYKNYYRLVPSWIALRYDIRPFFILEYFLSLEKIKNPFYYYKEQKDDFQDMEILNAYDPTIGKETTYFSHSFLNQPYDPTIGQETTEINILLLEKMKNFHQKKMLVLIDNLVLTEYRDTTHYQSVKNKYNINWTDYAYEWESLYRSFGHYSSLGYELSAAFFFNALIGKKHFNWKRIKCYFKKRDNRIDNTNINLSEVDTIKLTNSGISLLDFKLTDHKNNVIKRDYQLDHDTKSFISFSTRNPDDFGNSAYYPLPIQLKEGMKVYAQFSNQDKTELGTIHTFDPYEKFFDLYGKYITHYPLSYSHETYFIIDKMPSFLQAKINTSHHIELSVENYNLGTLHWYYPERFKLKKLIFNPHFYEGSFTMYGPSHYVREKDLPNKFPLYIQYTMNNGQVFKGQIGNWSCLKEKKQVHLNLSDFKPL